MLLRECPAPYTIIISKPAFRLCNSPVALRLAPRPCIFPRLPTAKQEERALIPRRDLHPLLDMRQERGRLTGVLLVRLQEPRILAVDLPAARAGVYRMAGHHDEAAEARKRVRPDLIAAAPHRPEPGLVHGQEDENAQPEGQQDEGDRDGVRLVEVPDLHQRRAEGGRGIEMRGLGLAALAGDPGLEIVVRSRVAEGLGAPGTEPLAAHRALQNSASGRADLGGDGV